jgi:hypothetical protein
LLTDQRETTLLPNSVDEIARDGRFRVNYNGAAMSTLMRRVGDAVEEALPPDALEASDRLSRDWDIQKYEVCEKGMPAILTAVHGEAVAVLRKIDDRVRYDCADGRNCANAIFELFDVSEDRQLSLAEIEGSIRSLAYVILLIDGDSLQNEVLAGVVFSSLSTAPLLAKGVVSSCDYNDDGRLAIAKVLHDHRGLMGSSIDKANLPSGLSSRQLINHINQIQTLLNGFLN